MRAPPFKGVLWGVLWDVDGTIAETERDGHRVAFNQAVEAHGIAWRWSVEHYGELLAIAGGRERLRHDMESRPDAPADAGERDMLEECRARGVPMARTCHARSPNPRCTSGHCS